jgi:predicted glycoside hydrolase/deacetylase ChbG (UPF0249 family)
VTRELIVNADDFGRTPGINRGVMEAHEHGIVTTASLMVRWPDAVEAADYARARRTLGLGLHVDLGEWVYHNKVWEPIYEVVDAADRAAVEDEVRGQLSIFRRLVGAEPTHLDSHQHVHRHEPVRSIMRDLAAELGFTLRAETPRIHVRADFYGQELNGDPLPRGIRAERLIEILRSLPNGISELVCHPGLGDDAPPPYVAERAREVVALCDPDVRAALDAEKILLRTFPARVTLR